MRHIVKGTVRRVSANTWEVLNNSTHMSEGISHVTAAVDSITVHFDFVGQKVIGGIAAPDETLAKAGIVTGASVGLSNAVIKFGRNGVGINPEAITAAGANVWLDMELFSEDI